MRTYMHLRRLAATGLIASVVGLSLSVGVAQGATCVGLYCTGPTGPAIAQQQQAAQQAVVLAQQIKNPVLKQAVLNAVKLSNQLAIQVNTLLQQAANTKNPVVKRQLEKAALLEARAAAALAKLARNFARVVVIHQKHPAADVARAQAHAKPNLASIQRQVRALLGQGKGNAAKANALIKQAAKLLRGRPSKRNQQKANALIAQAKKDVAKAQAAEAKAHRLVTVASMA